VAAPNAMTKCRKIPRVAVWTPPPYDFVSRMPLAMVCAIKNGLVGTVNQDRVSQIQDTNDEPANHNSGKRSWTSA